MQAVVGVSSGGVRLRRVVAWVVIAWSVSEAVLLGGSADRWMVLAAGLLVSVPLLAMRRAPVAVAAVVLAAYLVQFVFALRTTDAMSCEMAVAFALFGVGAYAQRSAGRVGAAVLIAAGLPGGVWLASRLDLGELTAVAASQYLYLCGVAFAGALPGFALSGRQREVAELDREIEALYGSAATEISVAVDEERRALGRDLVRIATERLNEVERLGVAARRALRAGTTETGWGTAMASAATEAADELRATLRTLTSGEDALPPGTIGRAVRPSLRRVDAAQLRSLGGLVLPVVLLAALSVIDLAKLPPLPVTLQTLSGTALTIDAPVFPPAVGVLLALLTPAGLLFRRRRPLLAVSSVAALVAVRAIAGELNSLTISHVFVLGSLAYVAGAYGRSLAEAVAALAVTLVTIGLCWHLEAYRFAPLVYGYMIGVLLATWGVGRAVHGDLIDAFALRRRVAWLRDRRDQLARAAVHGQRREVAVEMHDVVGHGLSLIAVHSGVVEAYAQRDRARALEALDVVEEAVATTHAELATLRAALGTPVAEAPGSAGFCQMTLERIVAEARRAGQPIRARIDAGVDALEGDTRATIVRIAQEALTNARKHAGSALTTLEVAVDPQSVRLEVRNAAGEHGERHGRGLGLRGMADRAALLGGTLVAGPGADGWFVRAELPRTRPADASPAGGVGELPLPR